MSIADDLGPVEGFARRAEHQAADFMRELMHPRHHDAPQPAADIPAIPEVPLTPTTEESVSLQAIQDIEDHIKAAIEDHIKPAIAGFEQLDREALSMVDTIRANPLASEAFQIIGALTGLPAADFTTALGVLRMVLAAAGGQAVTPAYPAQQ